MYVFFIHWVSEKEKMKKIISVLFCFCAVQLPVFALVEIPNVQICPAGAHWTTQTTDMSRKCVVCPEGKYTDSINSSVCITCPSGYDHTCDDSTECHDSVQDCYAIVTFHGNGGLSPKDNEDETVEVFYPKVEANFKLTPQCNLKKYRTGEPSLCSVQSGDGWPVVYKITDGVDNSGTVWKKTGYIFKGWAKNNTNKNPVKGSDTFSGDLNLYAMWEEETKTCMKGYYLPANASECAVCPAKTGRERGSYCEGGTYSILKPFSQGIEKCPVGFSLSDEGTEDEASCYTLFKFYPGKGGKFLDHIYNNNGEYSAIMYYGKHSDLFLYADGERLVKHNYLSGGSSQPTSSNRVFSHWELEIAAGRLPIKSDTSIPVDTAEQYRNIYAVWCGTNQIIKDYECVCKKGFYMNAGTGTCKKCKSGFTTMQDGAISEDECNKQAFVYGTDKTWTWPDAVKVGEIKNVKPK